jgi:hypothetical protein
MPDQVGRNGGLAEFSWVRLPTLFHTAARAVLEADASSAIDRQDDARNKCGSR